jgi:hypothetical protein
MTENHISIKELAKRLSQDQGYEYDKIEGFCQYLVHEYVKRPEVIPPPFSPTLHVYELVSRELKRRCKILKWQEVEKIKMEIDQAKKYEEFGVVFTDAKREALIKPLKERKFYLYFIHLLAAFGGLNTYQPGKSEPTEWITVRYAHSCNEELEISAKKFKGVLIREGFPIPETVFPYEAKKIAAGDEEKRIGFEKVAELVDEEEKPKKLKEMEPRDIHEFSVKEELIKESEGNITQIDDWLSYREEASPEIEPEIKPELPYEEKAKPEAEKKAEQERKERERIEKEAKEKPQPKDISETGQRIDYESFIKDLKIRWEDNSEIKIQEPGKAAIPQNCEALGFRNKETKEWITFREILQDPDHIYNVGKASTYEKALDKKIPQKSYYSKQKLLKNISSKLVAFLNKEFDLEIPPNYRIYERCSDREAGFYRLKVKIVDEKTNADKKAAKYSRLSKDKLIERMNELAAEYRINNNNKSLEEISNIAIILEQKGWMNKTEIAELITLHTQSEEVKFDPFENKESSESTY